MQATLVMTASQHNVLFRHLFPGDGLESVAIVLCHQGCGTLYRRLSASELILIPDERSNRSDLFISWPFADYMPPKKISEIDNNKLSIVTIHSHPSGVSQFSKTDNDNDRELLASINNWFDDDRPNGAAIMLPDGSIKARVLDRKKKFHPMPTVSSTGENIHIWKSQISSILSASAQKNAQTFGKGTLHLLKQLRVGIVGCSGTGSIIAELAARNHVGALVLVDGDVIEEKNLNRIMNSTLADARQHRLKVAAIRSAIENMGLDTHIDAYQGTTGNADIVAALIDCDILFGCVDSAYGRYHLDCIASAYLIPYFDVGVGLEADGKGGITEADAVAHYVHPEGKSLLSRNAYSIKQVSAENMQRLDPEHYNKQRLAGYLAAVGEDQPAVISLNMQAACMAFNDFLARLHNYRWDDNGDFSEQRFRLVHGSYEHEKHSDIENEKLFARYRGKGDRSVLIKNNKNHAHHNTKLV